MRRGVENGSRACLDLGPRLVEARAGAEAAAVWRLLGVQAPEAGSVSLGRSGHGTLAAPGLPGWAGAAGLLSVGEFEGDVRLKAQDVTLREIASGLDANIPAPLPLHPPALPSKENDCTPRKIDGA